MRHFGIVFTFLVTVAKRHEIAYRKPDAGAAAVGKVLGALARHPKGSNMGRLLEQMREENDDEPLTLRL